MKNRIELHAAGLTQVTLDSLLGFKEVRDLVAEQKLLRLENFHLKAKLDGHPFCLSDVIFIPPGQSWVVLESSIWRKSWVKALGAEVGVDVGKKNLTVTPEAVVTVESRGRIAMNNFRDQLAVVYHRYEFPVMEEDLARRVGAHCLGLQSSEAEFESLLVVEHLGHITPRQVSRDDVMKISAGLQMANYFSALKSNTAQGSGRNQ